MGRRVGLAPRSRERIPADWLLYALTLVAARLLPQVFLAAGWMPDARRLVGVALWGCALGLVAARTLRHRSDAWLLGLAVGMIWAAQMAGEVLPPAGMAAGDVQRVAAWLREWLLRRELPPNLPLSFSLTHVYAQGEALVSSVLAWVEAVRSGTSNADNRVLALGVSLGAWVLCWNAGHQAGRWGRALAGLAPLGGVALVNAAFTGLGLGYAQAYLAITLLAWLWADAGRRQRLWRMARVSIAPRLRTRTALAGLPLGGLVLALALVIPYADYERDMTWERMNQRLRTFWEGMDRAFAGHGIIPRPTRLRVIEKLVTGATFASPQLAEHDIGGGAPLGDELVFTVQTSDQPPTGGQPPRHYWRERTYDQFTGRGWASSSTVWAPYPAQAIWKEVGYPHTTLTQTFSLPGVPGFAYAANELVVALQPYRLLTRGSGDLAGFTVGMSNYSVVSHLPDAAMEELATAEGAYPDWVAGRYLAPGNISQRTRRTAQRVVQRAGASTRYEQARAIEAYLRTFVYDADTPAPPAGVDVVDYFLQLRRGYCEYSATAMVVMLRSLGIAARYASGFGPGEYDGAQGAWVVRARNAHAWAEVYFPGYGWIEFEPTPSEPLGVRVERRPTPIAQPAGLPADPAATATPALDPGAQADTPGDAAGRLSRGALMAGGGALLLLACVLVYPAWGQAFSVAREPRQAILQSYERVLRRARWLGAAPRSALTPREALQAVARKIRRRSRLTPQAARDLAELGQLYERARYGRSMLGDEDRDCALSACQRLRQVLTRAFFTRSKR